MHPSLSEQAYHQIRKKILTLELAPGTIINEADLRHELGLGRTPIREALLRLAQQKLVTIVPRRGMFVTDIRLEDIRQLFELRLALERLAGQLAAQRRHLAAVVDGIVVKVGTHYLQQLFDTIISAQRMDNFTEQR